MSSRQLRARVQCRKKASSTRPAASAVRSIPEEKARPAPRTTTTHTAVSREAASAASASDAARSASSALSTRGRFKVMVPTPSLTSYSTLGSLIRRPPRPRTCRARRRAPPEAPASDPIPRSRARLSKSEQVAGDHHALDLGGALADLGELGVAEHALDRELRDVARPAVDLEGLGRRLHRDLGGEDLGHRG